MANKNSVKNGNKCNSICYPCNKNIDYSCFMRNSISHLTSLMVFGVAISKLIYEYIIKNNNPFTYIDIPLRNCFYGFIILFSLHWFRVYLRMLIVDDDENYCFRILSTFSPIQLFFEWISRFSIIASLFLMEVHPITKNLFYNILIVYLCLLLWDTLIFSFYFYNTRNSINPVKRNSLEWISYFICDFFGIGFAVFLILAESDSIGTPGLSGVLLGCFMTLFIFLLVWDLWINKQIYSANFKRLLPNFKCHIEHAGSEPVTDRTYKNEYL
jgi:hypothetical protein